MQCINIQDDFDIDLFNKSMRDVNGLKLQFSDASLTDSFGSDYSFAVCPVEIRDILKSQAVENIGGLISTIKDCLGLDVDMVSIVKFKNGTYAHSHKDDESYLDVVESRYIIPIGLQKYEFNNKIIESSFLSMNITSFHPYEFHSFKQLDGNGFYLICDKFKNDSSKNDILLYAKGMLSRYNTYKICLDELLIKHSQEPYKYKFKLSEEAIEVLRNNKDSFVDAMYNNTMDKYEGVWKSDFLIGPGIVNTKFIKYDRFIPLIEHLLLDIEKFEKYHNYFVAGIELDYFNQCKVFKHRDHINFDNRRIRIFLPVQINDDENKITGAITIGNKIHNLENGQLIFDCTQEHSATINGEGFALIIDLLPKSSTAKERFSYIINPLMYYYRKELEAMENDKT
jgi:hypothetical protein|nr:MAG TPA: hypothetical protein [Caudoviricetes sp.]